MHPISPVSGARSLSETILWNDHRLRFSAIWWVTSTRWTARSASPRRFWPDWTSKRYQCLVPCAAPLRTSSSGSAGALSGRAIQSSQARAGSNVKLARSRPTSELRLPRGKVVAVSRRLAAGLA